MAGILSKGIKLGYSSTVPASTYIDLENLQQVPDLGGDVEQVDVTCLADENYCYIPGIKNFGSLEFTFLFDNSGSTSNYRVLQGLEDDVVAWQVTFPDALTDEGHGTQFSFTAIPHVKVNSASVNAALQFTLTLALQSEITVGQPT